VGRLTLGPRTCTVRQEVAAWGQQHGAFPFWLAKPGRPRQEPPRHGHGQSVVRRVPVEYAAGRLALAAIRLLGVHARQVAHQAAAADAAAQAQEAARVAAHVQPGAARGFACVTDAEAALAASDGRGQGRCGRKPRPGRSHGLHSRGEAVSSPQKRSRRGRPPQADAPQVEARSRRVVPPEALAPSEDAQGGTVLATTVRPAVGTDTARLQAYQEHHITVEPGWRGSTHPAAISPVWLEKAARIAALAMRTVVGLLV